MPTKAQSPGSQVGRSADVGGSQFFCTKDLDVSWLVVFRQPLWKIWVSNSWDDYSIPNWMEKNDDDLTILKNISQLGWWFPTEWKNNPFMFQTTKQHWTYLKNVQHPILDDVKPWLFSISEVMDSPNSWMVDFMENLMELDDFLGYPYFRKPPYGDIWWRNYHK